MEFELSNLLFYTFSFLLILISLRAIYNPFKKNKTLENLPPGPPRLPIIGNLHQMRGEYPHLIVKKLVEAYGPVMYLKLGQVEFVVTSSRESAEEVLKTQDLNFAFRPNILFGQILMYDCSDLVFSPYGPYYKQLRKLFIMELLSPKRVKSFSLIRQEENDKMVIDLAEASKTYDQVSGVNIRDHLNRLTSTILMRTAFGRLPIKNASQFMVLITQVLAGVTGFTVADFFPSIKFLSVLSGLRPKLGNLRTQLDGLFDEIVAEHSKMTGKVDADKEDLLDVLLRLKEHGGLEVPLSMENIRAAIIDAFVGGTETSSSGAEWVMSELVKNPRVLKKAQEEVRKALEGKLNNLHELDIGKLEYLHLVVKETLRMHPIAPILMPRVCQETCQIQGYTVPAGSRMLVNAYTIMRDPKYWEDPNEFKPERFEINQVDYKGTNYEYLPFGAGRRMCPGLGFGVANIMMSVSCLLYYFDWKMPGGVNPEDLDMSEAPGAAPVRKNPLHLIPVLRHAPPPVRV
ncbi:hypothetical protein LUZ60_015944 [Juncus effusus]|nr:hypothetical protein LUZ60_015944 [Juncus effusus]